MNFREITLESLAEFQEAMGIYVASFPENERRPVAAIKEMMKCGRSRLIVGEMEVRVVFMALLYPLAGTSFLLADYLATAECCRGNGLGKAFLRHLLDETARTEFRFLLIQIENPHLDDDEMKKKRLRFYKGLGMKEMMGVRYILPPLQGTKTTELVLMVNSREDEDCLDGKMVRNLVILLFGMLYDRHEGDELLMSTLRSIPYLVRLD